jgi:hypothetical protein
VDSCLSCQRFILYVQDLSLCSTWATTLQHKQGTRRLSAMSNVFAVNVHVHGISPDAPSNSLTVNIHVHGSVAESPFKWATVKVSDDACRRQCPGNVGSGCPNRKVLNPWWEYHLCTRCAQAIVDDVVKNRCDRERKGDGTHTPQHSPNDNVVRVRRPCPGFLGRECPNRKVLNPWWAYELCTGCATSIVDAVSKKSGNAGVTDLGDSEGEVPRANVVPTIDPVPSVEGVQVRSAQSDVPDESLIGQP